MHSPNWTVLNIFISLQVFLQSKSAEDVYQVGPDLLLLVFISYWLIITSMFITNASAGSSRSHCAEAPHLIPAGTPCLSSIQQHLLIFIAFPFMSTVKTFSESLFGSTRITSLFPIFLLFEPVRVELACIFHHIRSLRSAEKSLRCSVICHFHLIAVRKLSQEYKHSSQLPLSRHPAPNSSANGRKRT